MHPHSSHVRLATNYRSKQPRTPEQVGRLGELIAMMQDIAGFSEA